MTVIIDRAKDGGTQQVHRFDNGYGASVVRSPYTYGGLDGLYEVGVIVFDGASNNYQLTYSTPITDDVLGYLTADEVDDTLAQIAALPPREEA